MSLSSSIPVTRLVVGPAADQRLDQILGLDSSRSRVLVPTLNAARNGYGVPGKLAPPAARGLRAWIDGTEEIRLRLHGHGWTVPVRADLDGAGMVISPDGETVLAMVSGDGATGRAAHSPQVRYPRGKVASEAVQGSLFDGYKDPSNTMRPWFLLHEIGLNGWKAELARPADVGKTGWVTGWTERIQIVEDRSDSGGEDTTKAGPDLPAPTVRWRESA